jgi:hypothetical protein
MLNKQESGRLEGMTELSIHEITGICTGQGKIHGR